MKPIPLDPPAVLIVDDEEIIRSLLLNVFQRDGRYTAAAAVDGLDALRLLQEREFSLVITDLQMPNLGGLQLLRRLRHTHPDLPVVVFTGYGDIQDAIEALRLGALNFFRKPFDLKEIIPSVEKAIEVTTKLQRHRHVYNYVDSLDLRMTIPPRLEQADAVLQHLLDPLVPMGITDEAEVKNVFLALDEVLSNAIAYGALSISSSLRDGENGHAAFEQAILVRQDDPSYSARLIHLEAQYNQSGVLYRVTDPGDGFDHRNLPDPTCPENLLREHGRGLLLVQCFMDDLAFNERGNEVTLFKRRQSGGGEEGK